MHCSVADAEYRDDRTQVQEIQWKPRQQLQCTAIIRLKACSRDETRCACAGSKPPQRQRTPYHMVWYHSAFAPLVSRRRTVRCACGSHWKSRNPPRTLSDTVPRLLTLPNPAPSPTPRERTTPPRHLRAPEINLAAGHAALSGRYQRRKTPPGHAFSNPAADRYTADAMAWRQIPIPADGRLWAPCLKLLGALETRDSGTEKTGLGPARQMWQGCSRLGSRMPVSADPVGWLPRVMPLHSTAGGVWVKENFQFPAEINWYGIWDLWDAFPRSESETAGASYCK